MNEGEWHKKVRRKLIQKFEKEGYTVESSHGEKSIRLYHGEPSDRTYLSEADLILFNDSFIVKIVEIKYKDITPKNMVGIIKTTDLCDRCKIGKNIYDLHKIELLIFYKKQLDESVKSDQLKLIKENLKLDGCLSNYYFKIMDE